MKKLLFLLLFAAAMTVATAQNGEEPIKREHRSVWMSAYVSDWPAGKITTTNMKTMKAACQKMLDTLKVNNMNAVYYHVRAMCDAMYESAYEPWSSYVSGQRGVAPPFDPFAWLLQEAHARGIEVYAWVNPYRYARSPSMWGQSELDYVYTHPEWLMTTDYETVLNPGLPEVRQRVVDVCRDIITKYDVDGLVFDDYFYNQGGSSFDLDSALYNAYRRGGGTMSQGDWRRENVNMMVHDVNEMVKTTKPWVRFGIGPAGVACSSGAVAAQYG
ncbi:MAG: family 10 glycosylhydrolase, partial [Muribaculaceae bacterium]|nr:family 10 glycosylhydrolase [Muribaculaceae bacterium]